ncbi:Endothelin-converting enzyme 1 [Exaiptasia diaphana]|nr:Endothelin-converting enzyme 1 [Exaiptasia diaphana]
MALYSKKKYCFELFKVRLGYVMLGYVNDYYKLAYQNWVTKHETERILPGLKLTPEQLFFVGFAQRECSIFTTRGAANRQWAKHTTPKYRIIGALSNFDKFSKAFRCPSNSRMNPIKKCSVW